MLKSIIDNKWKIKQKQTGKYDHDHFDHFSMRHFTFDSLVDKAGNVHSFRLIENKIMLSWVFIRVLKKLHVLKF